ncbi:hypothetical protein [Aquimarina rhabdastrellae]
MKNYIYVIFLIIVCDAYSQIDFEEHIKSIKKEQFYTDDRTGEKYNVNERSVDYAINYLKKNRIKEKYITNRNLLKKIVNIECRDSLYTSFNGKLKNGTEIKVNIKYKKFDSKKHKIELRNNLNYFDGEIGFGAYYRIPSLEIDNIDLIINNRKVFIPREAFNNFFDVNQCESFLFYKPVEIFSSKDGKYIFIYLYGGIAANTYFAKLIFNENEYITQIVADYRELVDWRVTKNIRFLGF